MDDFTLEERTNERAAVLLVKKPLCCHIVTRLNHVRKRTDTVRDQMNSICPSSYLYLFYLGWNNNMKGSSSPIHIYSTENLLLLQQTSKENLELYFLSVVNRPKWVGKSIHKNQQKKNASFFFQAKMCTNLFLEFHFMSFHWITATIDFTMNYLSNKAKKRL